MDPEGLETLTTTAVRDLELERLELFMAGASHEELKDHVRGVYKAMRIGVTAYAAALPPLPIAPYASAAS